MDRVSSFETLGRSPESRVGTKMAEVVNTIDEENFTFHTL